MAKDIDVVSETLPIIKRIEKVCQENNCPYFTDGSVSYNDMIHSARKGKGQGRSLINWEDLKGHIEQYDILNEMTSEFNLESSPQTFFEWMEKKTVKRSTEIN